MSTNDKPISIFVEYKDTEIAKSLESIIKSPYKDDFVKLLTPMLCTSEPALKLFTKIFTGNGLEEPIPNNTSVYINIDKLGWGVDVDDVKNTGRVRKDNTILASISKFCGYHTPFQYEISFYCKKGDELEKKLTTVKGEDLIIYKEF